MNVRFNGFGENVLTFETQGTVNAGEPVMISSSGKVSAASGAFCGVCRAVRNGYAAVQLSGYVTVPYSAAPNVGYVKLASSGGSVAASEASGAREYLVADVDTVAGTVGIIL